jgi:hypothetical protein
MNEGVRRARKRNTEVASERSEMRKIYERAATLRRHGVQVHVDHKVPLSKGGTHTAENLQIIPEFENSQKHTDQNYNPIFTF